MTETAAVSDVTVRITRETEADHWAGVAASGWAESPEIVAFVRTMGQVSARAESTYCFFADRDHEPIATASMHVHAGVATQCRAQWIPHRVHAHQVGADRVAPTVERLRR